MSKHPAADIQLPRTSQVTTGLEKTKEALEEEAQKRGIFSPERKVAKDAAQFVDTTKQFIETKNQGELVQHIVKEASLASEELAEIFKKQKFFADRGQMITMKIQAQDYANLAKERLESLKTLAIILVNSSEFRGLLTDLAQLVKETFQTEVESTQTAQTTQQAFTQIQEKLPIAVPEDKKQLVNFRFKQILRKVSSEKNFQSAVDGLFTMMDQVSYWASEIGTQAQEAAQQTKEQTHLKEMFCDLKTFIAGFTGQQALDDLYNDSKTFMQLVQQDSSLQTLFWDLRSYSIEVLRNPDLLENEQYKNQWNSLFERANTKLKDAKFHSQWNSIWKDLLLILDNVKNDSLQQKLTEDATKLAHDLFLDTSGKPNLNVIGSGLQNVKNLVIPVIKKNLENVNVGPLSGSNETYDWVIENLTLNLKDILPDHIEMKMWGRADVSLTDAPSKALTYLTMWIRKVEVEAKEIKFWFHRKTVPKLDERGIANVVLKGDNELKITWKIDGSQDKDWKFDIAQIRCTLDNLDITIKESTHTFLMKMITSLFAGSIRRSWQDRIENNVQDALHDVNTQLNDAIQQVAS